MEKKALTVYLPPELGEKLEEAAKKTGRSVSGLVVWLLSRVDLEAMDA